MGNTTVETRLQPNGRKRSPFMEFWRRYRKNPGAVLGLKVLCVLVPAVFILGSWAAFKFVWNITPEVRAEMAAKKTAVAAATQNTAE